MSAPQVEGVTDIHSATVLKWARESGVVRSRSTISLSKREKEEIRSLYVTYRHSIKQVSLITGISRHKIFYWLNKQGLTRSKAESMKLRAWKRKQRSKSH